MVSLLSDVLPSMLELKSCSLFLVAVGRRYVELIYYTPIGPLSFCDQFQGEKIPNKGFEIR